MAKKRTHLPHFQLHLARCVRDEGGERVALASTEADILDWKAGIIMVSEDFLGATVFGGTAASRGDAAVAPTPCIANMAKVGLPFFRDGERHPTFVRADQASRDDALPALSAVKLPGHHLDAHGGGSAVVADSVNRVDVFHWRSVECIPLSQSPVSSGACCSPDTGPWSRGATSSGVSWPRSGYILERCFWAESPPASLPPLGLRE